MVIETQSELLTRKQACDTARQATNRFRLPFRSETWQGQSGQWAGSNSGASIDFQDHRAYVPGDDPRHINWQAYARSGHYTMKLYREEVSPQVDIALDQSASMFCSPTRTRSTLELFSFVSLSAQQCGARIRPWLVNSTCATPLSYEAFEAGQAIQSPTEEDSRSPMLERIPWRPHALRILISDLLFPGNPFLTLDPLCTGNARALIFSPWAKNEATPSDTGNIRLRDCESNLTADAWIREKDISNYQKNYRNHLNLWRDACLRRGVPFARVCADLPLIQALQEDALKIRAIESWI